MSPRLSILMALVGAAAADMPFDIQTQFIDQGGCLPVMLITALFVAKTMASMAFGKTKLGIRQSLTLVSLIGINWASFGTQYNVHTDGAVLVTGCSSGIGLDAALRINKAGFTVFAGVRTQKDADKLVALSPSLRPIILDVTKGEHISQAQITIEQSGLPLVGLVNNAGAAAMSSVELEAPNSWILEVNFLGVAQLTHKLMPLLRKSKGRVVNIGSMYGNIAPQYISYYSASKAAIKMLSDSLRREMYQIGDPVSVSIVEPGFIKTPLVESAVREAVEKTNAAVGSPYHDSLVASTKGICAQPFLLKFTTVSHTSDAIEHALRSLRPRVRYLVGLDAKLFTFLSWLLPERLMDQVLSSFFNNLARPEVLGPLTGDPNCNLAFKVA